MTVGRLLVKQFHRLSDTLIQSDTILSSRGLRDFAQGPNGGSRMAGTSISGSSFTTTTVGPLSKASFKKETLKSDKFRAVKCWRIEFLFTIPTIRLPGCPETELVVYTSAVSRESWLDLNRAGGTITINDVLHILSKDSGNESRVKKRFVSQELSHTSAPHLAGTLMHAGSF